MRAEFAFIVLGISFGASVSGCARSASSAAPPAAVAPSADEPAPEAIASAETAFQELEQRLLAEGTRLRFHITAEGAVEVDLRGELRVDDELDLRVKGLFAGEAYELRLWTQGDLLLGGPVGTPAFEQPRPAALAPAIVVGLTRMGLLHNIAVLIAGAPPDHGEGGVEQWVQTVGHHRVEAGAEEGEHEGLSFDLVVAGQPSGTATLWLDEDGQPRRRMQAVAFPDGEMRVIERYEPVGPESSAGPLASRSAWAEPAASALPLGGG
ncbi:MAG: hypothetical protein H6712_32330 [Myxococcales bacterium]|nr:hypothetical protein [Myxococcales bacterium]MCB9718583.1 hypothetical protein [Myxococcales bacterium]